jgi:hypothetical protein
LPMPRLAPVIKTLFSANRFMVGMYIYTLYFIY